MALRLKPSEMLRDNISTLQTMLGNTLKVSSEELLGERQEVLFLLNYFLISRTILSNMVTEHLRRDPSELSCVVRVKCTGF
jgi:hypothetical protein